MSSRICEHYKALSNFSHRLQCNAIHFTKRSSCLSVKSRKKEKRNVSKQFCSVKSIAPPVRRGNSAWQSRAICWRGAHRSFRTTPRSGARLATVRPLPAAQSVVGRPVAADRWERSERSLPHSISESSHSCTFA